MKGVYIHQIAYRVNRTFENYREVYRRMSHMEVRAYGTRHTYINNCENESYIK